MKSGPVVSGMVLIVLAPFIIISATVYTLMLPNSYSSAARISVSEDAPEINPFAEQGESGAYNPYFLRTQFELIQSKPILDEVVTRLNLQTEWGLGGEKLPQEVANKILRNSVNVFQQRDTSLIVISVKRQNPDEAAHIANEIAETYRDARIHSSMTEARSGIEKMEGAVKEQLARIKDAEQKVESLRNDLGLVGVDRDELLRSTDERSAPLREAYRGLENENMIYDALVAKHRQEIISFEIPRNPVEIIDVAEPDRRPVSPNLFMNVILSVFVAGGFGIAGGILLFIGLRKRPPPLPRFQ